MLFEVHGTKHKCNRLILLLQWDKKNWLHLSNIGPEGTK